MSDQIVNRVAKSALKTIDLELLYPKGPRLVLDIKDWLFQELILKEVDFRAQLKSFDWSQYKNTFVALTCSTDAIIPSWAYLLITTYLSPFAKKIVVGDLEQLETAIFQDLLNELPLGEYKDKPVIVKGCASKAIPNTSYVQLVSLLQPVAKSISFGEPCSTVPLYMAAQSK